MSYAYLCVCLNGGAFSWMLLPHWVPTSAKRMAIQRMSSALFGFLRTMSSSCPQILTLPPHETDSNGLLSLPSPSRAKSDWMVQPISKEDLSHVPVNHLWECPQSYPQKCALLRSSVSFSTSKVPITTNPHTLYF